ncbi:PQQ-dependent sugar dehydrogenase [Paracraurococcus lichenis]|uniref:PQQ-dependent sugar dehydrogenase n=1 Tax=Paracraurococcus lichenis TaxID=3064888 RepID=A0ABT9DW71_9PROT|nr:PQQ-dependent sugar dehydrogenase [Paracraurococcus sp. LOR1-02]MDO9708045.1 PQQ-dependent sugar dehydrogenase [Paracraurococcus sp. LOR1-02]
MARLLLLALLLLAGAARAQPLPFRVADFATGLDHPWGAAFLPDGRLLVTERPGRLRLVGKDGQVSPPLAGVPEVEARGQGGLLDVALAPDFATTREVYLCQSALVQGGALTRLVRARLAPDATALEGATPILDATPPQESGRNHFGCRIVFGRDGALFLSTGDRFVTKMRAQGLDDLAGKVLRLGRDGAALPDNPFVGRPGVRPEIFTLGHRHPQGLAFNPWTGSLWEAEFGARGGDEINVLKPGRNHGWPIVTKGVDYDGSRIGEGTSRPDLEEPVHWWVPSVSPSGIAFYTGSALPAWRGSLFVAALNPPGLVRLSTEGDRVTGEERLLWNRTRLRQVVQGPDGLLYLLTDETRGRILRLEPG